MAKIEAGNVSYRVPSQGPFVSSTRLNCVSEEGGMTFKRRLLPVA